MRETLGLGLEQSHGNNADRGRPVQTAKQRESVQGSFKGREESVEQRAPDVSFRDRDQRTEASLPNRETGSSHAGQNE